MFGTPSQAAAVRTVPLAGPAPTSMSSNGRLSASAVAGGQETAKDWTPWVLVTLLALWLLWSLVERHQRVRQVIQPRNVVLNLRTLAAVILPVILGLALLRILLVKLKVWTSGIPYVSDLVGSLIHVVGS